MLDSLLPLLGIIVLNQFTIILQRYKLLHFWLKCKEGMTTGNVQQREEIKRKHLTLKTFFLCTQHAVLHMARTDMHDIDKLGNAVAHSHTQILNERGFGKMHMTFTK